MLLIMSSFYTDRNNRRRHFLERASMLKTFLEPKTGRLCRSCRPGSRVAASGAPRGRLGGARARAAHRYCYYHVSLLFALL